MRFVAFLLAACAVLTPARSQVEAPDVARVAHLVHCLDAPRFEDREAASAALQAMGGAILPLLEPHRTSASLEVRARVEVLLEAIRCEASVEGLDGPADQLLRALAVEDPFARSARVHVLVRRARPSLAFAKLLELARRSRSRRVVGAALEGLARLAAPRRVKAFLLEDTGQMVEGQSLVSTLEELAGLRLSATQHARLAAAEIPELNEKRESVFDRLIELGDHFDFAYVLHHDPLRRVHATGRVIEVLSAAEAIGHWTQWLVGEGRDRLAWDDFVWDKSTQDYDANAAASRAAWCPKLLDSDPVVRRQAAYVLGRTPGAEAELALARDRAPPEVRATLDEALDRARLRSLGEVLMVSDRGGSDQVWRQRIDGASPRQVTQAEPSHVVLEELSPTGEHVKVCVGADHTKYLVEVDTGRLWRPGDRPFTKVWWSPNGRRLGYAMDYPQGFCELRLLDVDSGRDSALGWTRQNPWRALEWAPDGTQLLCRLDEAGGSVLAVGDPGDPGKMRRSPAVGLLDAWWASKAELVLASGTMQGASSLELTDRDGRSRGRMALDVPKGRLWVTLGAPSPDRCVVSVRNWVGGPQQYAYRVVLLDDGLKVFDVAGEPIWHPSSDRFAAFRDGEVGLYRRDGERLPLPPLRCKRPHLAWSADGKALFACESGSQAYGSRAVYVLDGPTWRQLIVLDYCARIVGLTPDGAWLLVETLGDLVAVSRAEGRALEVTDGPGRHSCFIPRFRSEARR